MPGSPADIEVPMVTLICCSHCPSCEKAIRYLEDHGIDHVTRDINEDRPTPEELKEWHGRSGRPLNAFWNMEQLNFRRFRVLTSSRLIEQEQQYYVLCADDSLIRHPLLVGENFAVPGFSEPQWAEILKKNS